MMTKSEELAIFFKVLKEWENKYRYDRRAFIRTDIGREIKRIVEEREHWKNKSRGRNKKRNIIIRR